MDSKIKPSNDFAPSVNTPGSYVGGSAVWTTVDPLGENVAKGNSPAEGGGVDPGSPATGDPVGENVANGASPPGVDGVFVGTVTGTDVFGDGGETGALTGAGMVVISLS